MTFEPVWVSSPQHLETFAAIFKSASWWRRLTGRYLMPPDFPCVEVRSGQRLPIILFAQGQLDVDSAGLRFRAVNFPAPAGRRLHLIENWEFTLKRRDIKAFEGTSPALRYYRMNFSRVRSEAADVPSDLLFCVGGAGPLMNATIRARSARLQEELLALMRDTP